MASLRMLQRQVSKLESKRKSNPMEWFCLTKEEYGDALKKREDGEIIFYLNFTGVEK